MTPKPWRPDLYVLARYLEALRERDRAYTRRQLQMAVKLNHDLHARYLAFLEERGYVVFREDDRGVETARLTAKGVEAYHRFVGWVRELLGTPPTGREVDAPHPGRRENG